MEERVSIEQTFEQLDELIRQLESGELSLEESFSAYEKGLGMVKLCRESVDEVEKKVLVLDESGEQHEF